MAVVLEMICPTLKAEYFCDENLTRIPTDLPVGHLGTLWDVIACVPRRKQEHKAIGCGCFPGMPQTGTSMKMKAISLAAAAALASTAGAVDKKGDAASPGGTMKK